MNSGLLKELVEEYFVNSKTSFVLPQAALPIAIAFVIFVENKQEINPHHMVILDVAERP